MYQQGFKKEATLPRSLRFSTGDIPTGNGNVGDLRALRDCVLGSGVAVTSPSFPLLEGCLAEDQDGYLSDTGLIVSGEVEEGDSTMVKVLCILLC